MLLGSLGGDVDELKGVEAIRVTVRGLEEGDLRTANDAKMLVILKPFFPM
jgi:hypothetical protein